MDVLLVWIWIIEIAKWWLLIEVHLALRLHFRFGSALVLYQSSIELVSWCMSLMQVLLVEKTLVRWMWNLLGRARGELLRHEIRLAQFVSTMNLVRNLLVVVWRNIRLVQVGQHLRENWFCVVKRWLTFSHMRGLINLLRRPSLHLVNDIILVYWRLRLVHVTSTWIVSSASTELLESALICLSSSSHEICLKIALLLVWTFSFVFVHILNCSFLEWITTV